MAVQITTGGRERVEKAAELLSDAFETDPTVTYILSSLSLEERNSFRPKFFSAMLTAAAINGATFDEANGWKSCGVMFPPRKTLITLRTVLLPGSLSAMWTLGFGRCHRMMFEIPAEADRCKEMALKGQKDYYYIFELGTRKDGRGQGLCSAIVKHYQAIAAKAHLPIYMEAGTEYAWGLYKSLGFVTVDEMRVGKGTAAADGTMCEGGAGVKTWSLIWRPE